MQKNRKYCIINSKKRVNAKSGERMVNMKRFIMLLSLVSVFLLLGAQPVWAKTNTITEDSLNIDESIKNELQLQESDEVILVYNMAIYFAFSQYNTIDEVLNCDEMFGSYYAVKSSDGTYSHKYKMNGSYVSEEAEFLNEEAMRTCLEGSVTKYIASDVVVYNTYYLSGETSHMGTAICYKTNKGDYVYYDHYSIGECLFPIEAFCAFQKAVLQEAVKHGDKEGVINVKIWDLSAYDFNSDTFNLNAEYPGQGGEKDGQKDQEILLWIGISTGLCLAIVGAVFGVRYFRNRAGDGSLS